MQTRKDSVLQRLLDKWMGYDFFVSYSHRDGKNYPASLATRLKERRFNVFLDQTEYAPGMQLPDETRRRVHMSSKLILVARPAALSSQWVGAEIEAARAAGREIVPININDNIGKSDTALARSIRDGHVLRIEESLADPDAEPSDSAINALETSFTKTRQNTKRKLALAGVLLLLAAGGGATALALREARVQTGVAGIATDVAIQTADKLVYDLSIQLRDVEGMRIETVRKILDSAKAAIDAVGKSTDQPARLRRSRSALLRLLAETYGRLGDRERMEQSAIEGTAILRQLMTETPTDPELSRELNVLLNKVGEAQLARGDRPAARQSFTEALELIQRLLPSNPQSPLLRRDAHVSRVWLGNMALADGDAAQALAFYSAARDDLLAVARSNLAALGITSEIAEKAQIDPVSNQRDLAMVLNKIGDVEASRNQHAAALELYRESLSMRRRLAVQLKDDVRAKREVAVSAANVGTSHYHLGQHDLARQSFEESVSMFRELWSKDKGNMALMRDLSVGLNQLGAAHLAANNLASARIAWIEDLDLTRELAGRDPSNVDIKQELVTSLARVSELLAVENRLAEACPYLAEIRALRAQGIVVQEAVAALLQRLEGELAKTMTLDGCRPR